MMTGYTMRGREALRAIEHKMLAFDGTAANGDHQDVSLGRQLSLLKRTAIWGNKRTKACVFLTFKLRRNDRARS